MPIYDVHHIFDLSMPQKDKIAEGITNLHALTFNTPKLFVNVIFHDDAEKHTYVGGKRRDINKIVGTVRSGPSRTADQYNDVCREIEKIWNEAIGDMEGHPRRELRAIFILGSLIAGAEAGFILPQAGEDRQWLERNMEAFKQKADAGDTDFEDMLVDVEHREAFRGLVGDWKSNQELKEEREQKKKHEKEGPEGGEEVPDRSKES